MAYTKKPCYLHGFFCPFFPLIGNYDAMHELWDHLETICDDIILRIKSDKRNPKAKAIRDFDQGSVNVALIANENDKNYGVRCTFTISSPLSTDVNPAKWNYSSNITD